MRNAADAAGFESRRGRNRIARGIYEGLRRFLMNPSRASSAG
jgi:N-acetylmuramoyl-L-alanine amidase